MNRWYHSSVLSTEGWTHEQLSPIFELAARYKSGIRQRLDMRIPARYSCQTLFYEPSTRTRLSFESAAHHLGMSCLTVADAGHDSSATKGESLEDTGKIASAYSDVIIIRHPEVGSAGRLARAASVPVINAGDGAGEHPTQALLDLFTIQEAFGQIAGLHIGICGDLKHGRTVHSLLRVLINLGCTVTLISPAELTLPNSNSEFNLQKILPDLDVLYMTRIQKERFDDLELYHRLRKYYTLTAADLKRASPRLKVLHPLPRVDEMESEVDQDPRAHYFIQAANGVPVRMALLSSILVAA